jgi:hypothetical protein
MPARVGTLLGSLTLLCCMLSAAPSRIRYRELSRVRVAEPVLALAFVGERHALALARGSVSLWRFDGAAARLEAREIWSEATPPVRHAGALIVGRPDEKAAWLLSSHAPGARLVRVEGARLLLADAADAAPWPAAAEGLRFQPGTNRIEGFATDDGPQPLVAVDPTARALVRDDGMLLVDSSETGVRVGSALASLWPRTLAASAPDPPSARDAVLVLRKQADRWEEELRIEVVGRVAALAGRGDGSAADLLIALLTPAGCELLHLELRQE